jgi:hypothetical protein
MMVKINYVAVANELVDYIVDNFGSTQAIRALYYSCSLKRKEIEAFGFSAYEIEQAIGDE